MNRVKSPCVGICSTGIGDSVCRGCKRYMHEIIDWNGFSETQRRAIIQRISLLVQQVAEPVIEIVDMDQLKSGLAYQHVRYDALAGPYVWLLELLKVGASRIQSLAPFGCRLRPAYQAWSLERVRDQIDKDFFTLSDVHYQRYFASVSPASSAVVK